MKGNGESIMCATLEIPTPTSENSKLTAHVEIVKQIVAGIRTVRNQKNIAPKVVLELQVVGDNKFAKYNEVIIKMANLSTINVVAEKTADASGFMVGTNEYAVPIGNLLILRLKSKRQKLK